MDALEVCISGVITGLYQSFKAGLHQGADTAAQNGLLTEQIGFGLGAEVGLQHACASAADAQRISQTQIPGIAGGVLLNSDEAGNALAGLILAADSVAGALGGDHDDVDILGGLDAAEMDIEAVGEGQGLALGQVGFDGFLIQLGLLFIVDEDHDDIGHLGGIGSGHNLQALCLSLGPALGAFIQAYHHVDAAFLQVQRVCVALRTVTNDGNGLAVEFLQITILLIKDSCHNIFLLSKATIQSVIFWDGGSWCLSPGKQGRYGTVPAHGRVASGAGTPRWCCNLPSAVPP